MLRENISFCNFIQLNNMESDPIRHRKVEVLKDVQLIGEGGKGIVYLVREQKVDKNGEMYWEVYARKMVKYQTSSKVQMLKEFNVLSKMNNPHIVKNYEFFDDFENNKYYFLMENCDGGSLQSFILKEERLQKKLEVIAMIVAGVRYLHSQIPIIIHRDLKPLNILFKEGVIKIIDFGISKALEQSIVGGSSTVQGTQNYIAPQIYDPLLYNKGYESNEKIDIWALGIIIFEIMTNTLVQDMFKVGKRPPCDRQQFPNQDYLEKIQNQEMRVLIRLMLEKDQRKRLNIEQVWENVKEYYPRQAYRPQGSKKTKRYLCHLSDNEFYEGEMKEDKIEGKGIYYFSDGNRYVGDFENGVYDGKGIFYINNGSSYEGVFKKGKESGKGIYQTSEGLRYEGDFINGQNSFAKYGKKAEKEITEALKNVKILLKMGQKQKRIQKLVKGSQKKQEQYLTVDQLIEFAEKMQWQPIVYWIKSGKDITKMEKLNLDKQSITKIQNLETLTSLKQLSLSFNKITKIENLQTLTSLKQLRLQANQITKIENLKTLTSLQKLNLYSNQITKIQNLQTLTSLEQLQLKANKITKIENLETLKSLKYLCLHSNQITKIQNLEKLTSLQTLFLYSNKITKIENLEKLTSLKSLWLDYNPITKSHENKTQEQSLRKRLEHFSICFVD